MKFSLIPSPDCSENPLKKISIFIKIEKRPTEALYIFLQKNYFIKRLKRKAGKASRKIKNAFQSIF